MLPSIELTNRIKVKIYSKLLLEVIVIDREVTSRTY
jgi:hypothetical protein